MAYQPKSYRKFLAGTVSAAVVASAVAPVAAASFKDVPADNVHAGDINTLVEKGYIKGYPDETFKPGNSLTRGEAAIIFSRILKDAGVTEKGAGFPDVPASKAELAEAVAIVQAAGIMTGDDKGNFNPNANITREQMAKVVVEAFKLTKPANYTTKVTDLDKAAPWAREYIQVLEANGVTKNTEFAPKQNVTRAQFASFVVRAMNVEKEVSAADITAVKLVDEKTLEVTFNGELKDVKAEDFKIEGVEIESVSIKAAAAAEAKTTVVVIKTKPALQEGKSYSVSYKGQTTDKAKVDVPVVTPKVESVSANNLKTVVVKFNKEVDADTITSTTVKVYEGTNTTATTVDTTPESVSAGEVGYILSADKKSLTIVFGTSLSQSTKVKVVVDGVKATNGTAVEKAEKEVTVMDTTLPEVLSAKALNKKQVELQFSEPVNFSKAAYEVLNNIKVDGVAAIAKVTPNHAENKVVLEFASNLKTGTLKFDVSDIADFAGYKISAKQFDVEVAEDTAAPEIVKAEARNKNTIRVTFNEKVASVGSFEINDTPIATNLVTEVPGSNGTQFDITYTLDLSAVVEVRVEYKGQKDVADNEVKEWKTFKFSVADDTTLPTVTHSLGDGNKLTLTFSKSMKTNAGTIKVYDKDNKEVASLAVSGLTFKANTNNTVLELTGAQLGLDNVNAGQYTIKIKDMKDNSIRENLLPEQTITIEAKDTKKPLVTNGYLVTNGTLTGADLGKDDTITIFFNEPMDEATLKNLSNYSVNGTVLSTVSGAAVKSVAADGKSVVLTYPNARNLTTEQITLVALKDVAGNMINTTSISKLASTAVAVTGVEATKKNEIVVTFNTAIKSVDPSAIKIQKTTDGGATWTDEALPISATIDSTNNAKVKFVLNKDLNTTTANYRVVDNNSNLIKNIYDDAFKTNANDQFADLDADGTIEAGEVVAIADKIAPELVSVKKHATDSDKIVLTFSEALANPAAGFIYDLRVKNLTEDVELIPTTDFTVARTGANNEEITITIIKDGVDADKFSVELLNGRYLTDASVAANTAIAFSAKTVTDANGADALITERTAPTVDASKFSVGTDAATGSQDTIVGAAGAIGQANATVKAYLWTDADTDGVVDTGELGTAINLGTSAANGSVAAANIGDLAAGTYKFVITATDAAGNESAKDATAAATITLSN